METVKRSSSTWMKFILCSLVGAFMFFVTLPFNGKSTIPLDILCTVIRNFLGDTQKYFVVLVCVIGAALPFVKKTWNKDKTTVFFSIMKILGVIFAVMYVLGLGPKEWLTNDDLLPFCFDVLCRSLTFLIPLGAIFLAFLTNYGLLEFIGVFMQPIMRKVWKTPGRSAIDAVASFVGSYSVALLITDKLYQEGRYTKKEAAIIATGFSTVSTTFMITVAKTLDMMDRWTFYFWSTLIITFLVTAITVRLFPLSKVPNECKEGVTPKPEEIITHDRFRVALNEGLNVADSSGSLTKNIWVAFKDGLRMTCTVVPSIMSIGFLGMLLALFTPVFNWVGFIFYPFTALMQIPEALLTAQAMATSIAEMFLPCAFVTASALATRYVIAVGCISELLFFSAVIPCILSTEIPVKIPQLLLIWVERVILSILIAGAVALILF
ncbi:hypothetical protein OBV_40570 [Oscillibacter valericigenes Sjm18-20]|nr:hypothetical protein OBV_40570 [Oscillibacter valericigenes Sjm18-20]